MKLRKFTNIIKFWSNKFVWFVFRVKTRVVKCLIRHDQEILLVKLTYGPDIWKLPGGMVDRGESTLIAVKREVEEELSLKLDEVEPIGEEQGKGKRNNSTIYYFSSTLTHKPELQLDPVEIKEAGWFKISELPLDSSLQVHIAIELSAKGDKSLEFS